MDNEEKEEEPPKIKNTELNDTESDGKGKAGETGKDKEKDEVEEEEFLDAKEDGSVASNASKTQHAAGDSQHGTAEDTVPHPIMKEGGQEFTACYSLGPSQGI